MQGAADLVTFVSQYLSLVLAPVWNLWTAGTILSISLVLWLIREIVKSVRKIY